MSENTSAAPEVTRSRRSGSEKRQRTRQVKLSLLPSEEDVLASKAASLGFPSVQAFILDRLKPDLANAS